MASHFTSLSRHYFVTLFVSCLFLSTTSAQTVAGRDGGGSGACQSITDIACGSKDFQVLCEALHVTKLDVALQSGEWTVFAPTDDAFATLGDDVLDPMRTFRDNLEYLILTHAIPGQTLLADDLVCGSEWEMASQHETIQVVCRNNNIFIQGQGNTAADTPRVVDANLPACNGIIHVIDKVILPGDLPVMPGKADYCPYCPKPPPTAPPAKPPALPPTYAPVAAPYYPPQDPYEPYSPPKDPYYPPPPPQQPYYPPYDPNPYKPPNPHKNPNYPEQDPYAPNNPYAPNDPYDPQPSYPKKPLEVGHCETISDIICGADGFAVLCEALKVTGLYTALKHNQHYTLFAPTDTAFHQLLGGYYHDVTKDELTALLLYHVIHSKYDSVEFDELQCDTWIQMANGDYSFTLCRTDIGHSSYHQPPKTKKYQLGSGNSPMNEPEIILTASKGSVCNGVIHVVDNVLLPTPKLWEKYHGIDVYPGK